MVYEWFLFRCAEWLKVLSLKFNALQSRNLQPCCYLSHRSRHKINGASMKPCRDQDTVSLSPGRHFSEIIMKRQFFFSRELWASHLVREFTSVSERSEVVASSSRAMLYQSLAFRKRRNYSQDTYGFSACFFFIPLCITRLLGEIKFHSPSATAVHGRSLFDGHAPKLTSLTSSME